MLKNDYLLTNVGVDTAENEPFEVCRSKHAIPTPGLMIIISMQTHDLVGFELEASSHLLITPSPCLVLPTTDE